MRSISNKMGKNSNIIYYFPKINSRVPRPIAVGIAIANMLYIRSPNLWSDIYASRTSCISGVVLEFLFLSEYKEYPTIGIKSFGSKNEGCVILIKRGL
jgi:hypothetical protein